MIEQVITTSKIRNANIINNEPCCPLCNAKYKDTLLEKYGLAKDKEGNKFYEFVRRCTKCQTNFVYYEKELGGKRLNLYDMTEIKEKGKAKEDVDGE